MFLVISLVSFLTEIGGSNMRVTGLVLSLLFEVIGVTLLVLSRGGRSQTAGVALTAAGVIPLMIFLFVDVRNPSRTISSVGDFTSTATLVLVAAAVLWLVAHLFSPGRHHALYLGAALVAIWLAFTVQIVRQPLQDVTGLFGLGGTSVSKFESVGSSIAIDGEIGPSDLTAETTMVPFGGDFEAQTNETARQFRLLENGEITCEDDTLTEGDPIFWECDGDVPVFTSDLTLSDSTTTFDNSGEFNTDEFDSDPNGDFNQFDDQFDSDFGGDFTSGRGTGLNEVRNPATSAGWTTLFFGALYLLGGFWRDRSRDTRRGTAFYAVSIPLLFLATSLLSDPLGVWGTSLLAIAYGSAAAFLGSNANRRFTAWAGTLAAIGGFVSLIVDIVDGGNQFGMAFLLLGIIAAVAALFLDGKGDPTRPVGSPPDLAPMSAPTSPVVTTEPVTDTDEPAVDPWAPPAP